MSTENDAEKYFGRGIAKEKRCDYIGAFADFSKTIEKDPECAKAYANRGKIRGFYQNYAEALDDYCKATALDSTYAIVIDEKSGSKHNFKAIADPEKILLVDSLYVNEILYRGSKSYNDQKFKDAIDDFSKVINVNPENIDGFYCRANCYLMLNKYIEAIEDYSKVIELQPKSAEAYYFRGYSRIKLGQKYCAFGDFNKAGKLGITIAYRDFFDLSTASSIE